MWQSVSSAACDQTPDVFSIRDHRPATLGWALRWLRSTTRPPCTVAVLRVIARLQWVFTMFPLLLRKSARPCRTPHQAEALHELTEIRNERRRPCLEALCAP